MRCVVVVVAGGARTGNPVRFSCTSSVTSPLVDAHRVRAKLTVFECARDFGDSPVDRDGADL